MAFAAAASTTEPRAISLGPLKMEIQTWTAENTDTAGTVTASRLETVDHIIIDGMEQTAAPSISGKTITLAFTDPGASVAGTLILLGK